MKTQELRELFEIHRDDFLRFERVANPRSKRPDLHAFLVLGELVPSDRDIIAWAEHDEIGLDINVSKLAELITEDQVIELIRCGLRFNKDRLLVLFV